MDPYLDTIPYDQGEEIRKRVTERDGFDNEGRPTERARADTSTFLPPGGDGQEVEEPEPPKPEDDLDKYDRERLQNGLRYIHGAAKRKITPRTQEFLKLHKDGTDSAGPGPEGQVKAEIYKLMLHEEGAFLPHQDSKADEIFGITNTPVQSSALLD
jgi:hypothetical protein